MPCGTVWTHQRIEIAGAYCVTNPDQFRPKTIAGEASIGKPLRQASSTKSHSGPWCDPVPGRIEELFFMEGIEMLILSRKPGEALVIGNGIRVTVLEVRGNQVKIGFVAPAVVPIHRKEVQQAIENSPPALPHAECT